MKTQNKRAVLYVRVSTDKEEQKTSIKNQRIELQRMCEANEWYIPQISVKNLCDKGVYYDEGTSGTKLSRPAFDRLLIDAGLTPVVDADTSEKTTAYKIEKQSKFDYIVVKDASRFSRNVSINAILQTLKDNKVYVYFSDLNMSTERNEHWNIIQQFFIFAEGESRRKSTAVSFGYQAGVRQGKIYVGGNRLIGYDYDKTNNCLVINEEQAKVVRLVFDLYTEAGLGQYRICNKLSEKGYVNSNGKKYGRSTIKRMLQNEKYAGISNSGRYYKPDLFSNKRIERDYNDPLRVTAREVQQELSSKGIVKIPPIISIEQFEKAQEITARNREMYKVSKEWHGTTDYAKKVVCGCCGAFYRASGRKVYKKYGDKKIARYSCKHSISYDESQGIPKCKNPAILEPELDKELFGRKYWFHRRNNIFDLIDTGEFYISVLNKSINTNNIEAVKEIDEQIKTISQKRERLLDLYTDGLFTKEELEKRVSAFTDEIIQLNSKKEQLSKGNEDIKKDIRQVEELLKIAKSEQKEVAEIIAQRKYPKKTRKELLRDVDYILINSQGKPEIHFKSLESIKTTIVNMGIMIDSYTVDAEEAGWEDELKEAEKWAETTGFLQD